MRILYGSHSVSEKDVQAVSEVLLSEQLTQGPIVEEFERRLASFVGTSGCVVCSSGTAALHLACMAVGLRRGDIAWITSISFVATANAALYCGAEVDFLDIDIESFNVDIAKLEAKLVRARIEKKIPKVIIVTDMCGCPISLRSIREFTKPLGIQIIEDACHALGSKRGDSHVGGDCDADVTVFSFHPLKMITTGEGGALVSHDPLILSRARLLRSHGITKSAYNPTNPFEHLDYSQTQLGFNYRLPDILCALGLSQLDSVPERVKVRNSIASYYRENLSERFIAQTLPLNFVSAYHIYVTRVPVGKRARLIAELVAQGIQPSFHYKPIFLHDFYLTRMCDQDSLTASRKYYNEAITLPLHTCMSEDEIDAVVNISNRALR